jgi:hypothetical protein
VVVLEGLRQTAYVIRVAVVEQQAEISPAAATAASTRSRFGSCVQRLARSDIQRERFRESTRGVGIRLSAARFEMLDSPDAETGPLGQCGLS